MIINSILAVAWFVICCWWVINMVGNLWMSYQQYSKLIPRSAESHFLLVVTIYFVMGLVGIAASVLLLNGVTRARWLIGLVAIWNVSTTSVQIVFSGERLTLLAKVSLIVSVITLVIVIAWAANIFRL